MQYTLIRPLPIDQDPDNIFSVSILDDWNKAAEHVVDWGCLPQNVQIKAYHEKFANDADLITALQSEDCRSYALTK